MEAKEMAMDFKANLETVKKENSEMKEQISNLDKSVKEQQTTIESLRKAQKAGTLNVKAQIRQALEEKREDIQKFLDSKKDGSFTFSIKAVSPSAPSTIAGSAYSVAADNTVYGVPVLNNAFLAAFGTRPVAASRLAWVETEETKVIGYVGELATNSNNSEVTFSEKQRKMAKLATYIQISSELENWFEFCADYATNKVDALLLNKIDELVFAGAGNDSTKQGEIYGIKTNGSTAFAAAEKYADATEADLILACVNATKKNGYNANVAIVSFDTLATIRGLKDKNDNYLYNQVTGMLGQVRVLPSANIGAAEMLVADSTCVDIFVGGNLEIEFTRKAEIDGWRVDFRKNAQVKVPTSSKKGVIYVANIATAVTAITKS